MKVVFSEAARNDLLRIGDYIVEDNPLRALTFIDKLEERCMQLEHHPLAYLVLARRPLSNIRRLVHGHYTVFYSVGREAVHILHILHGAMDYERILFPEE